MNKLIVTTIMAFSATAFGGDYQAPIPPAPQQGAEQIEKVPIQVGQGQQDPGAVAIPGDQQTPYPSEQGDQSQDGYGKSYACENATLAMLVEASDQYDSGMIAFRHSEPGRGENLFNHSRYRLSHILRQKECISAATHHEAFLLYVKVTHQLRVVNSYNH